MTIYAIPAITIAAFKRGSLDLRYIDSTFSARMLMRFFGAIRIIPIKARKFSYILGDMWLGDETLGAKILMDVPSSAQIILKELSKSPLYGKLAETFPREKMDVFYEKTIADGIYGFVRALLIMRWDRSNTGRTRIPDVIFYEDNGLGEVIGRTMVENDVSIIPYPSFDIRKRLKNFLKPFIGLKSLVSHREIVLRMFFDGGRNNRPSGKPMIAVHYGHDDVDMEKRSDIFWFPHSGIDPQRIVIYFDKAAHPITASVAKKIEGYSMKWAWKDSPFMVRASRCVKCQGLPAKIRKIKSMRKTAADGWIIRVGEDMAAEVSRAVNFFEFYNVKINICIGTQSRQSVAQSIALDFIDSVRVFVQRTRIQHTQNQPFLRYNANHVLFVWGPEILRHTGTSRAISKMIVSGYPFDSRLRAMPFIAGPKSHFENTSAKFIITLFDAGIGKDTVVTEKITSLFYKKFFQWLIDDSTLGLVVKEKREKRPEELNDIKALRLEAERTGRYLRISNPFGKHPHDASRGADMAVGLFLTSALTEAVIGGTRGVYCDPTRSRYHYLYEWGYESIIFDDVDRLIEAMKKYKSDPASMDKLGNWSNHINEVEPFRDGKGGQRIGAYVKWLLDAFENGSGREKAMEYADGNYVNSWGKDKILNKKS